MKKTILLLALVLIGLIPATAQVDTVFFKQDEFFLGKVTDIRSQGNKLSIQRVKDPYAKQLKFPLTNVTKVHFADGFHLNFKDGKPVRDNLLSSPKIIAEDNKIMAEGLVRLNNNEIKTLLGDRAYTLGYQAGNQLYKSGAWLFGIGTLFGGSSVLAILIPDPITRRDLDYRLKETSLGSKEGSPGFIAGICFTGGLVISGLLTMRAGHLSIEKALNQRDQIELVSPRKAWTELGLGLAGTGAGFGMMFWGSDVCKRHFKTGNEHYNTGGVLLMVGGAILANVGITAFLQGSTHIATHFRNKSQLNLSATGISYRF